MRTCATEVEGFGLGTPGHEPVLLQQVVALLVLAEGGRYLDCTFGGGGHSEALLRADPQGSVTAMDRDPDAVQRARRLQTEFGDRFCMIHANFEDLASVVEGPFDGILFDLGVSSFHFDEAGRGFSFQREGPMDMRMDRERGRTAEEFLENASREELVEAIRDFGEERSWRKVVEAILESRGSGNFGSTTGFASFIEKALGGRKPWERIHPATRVFQGIRIAVNDELGALERALPAALDSLQKGGRLAVISFHSLEDRPVKRIFRRWAGRPEHRGDHRTQDERSALGRMVQSKAIEADAAERERNPRSRSARLRVFEKSGNRVSKGEQ